MYKYAGIFMISAACASFGVTSAVGMKRHIELLARAGDVKAHIAVALAGFAVALAAAEAHARAAQRLIHVVGLTQRLHI